MLRIPFAFLTSFLCITNSCVAGSSSSEEQDVVNSPVQTGQKLLAEHEAILKANADVLEQVRVDLEQSIAKNLEAHLGAVKAAADLFEESKREITNKVFDAAKVYVEKLLKSESDKARSQLRRGEVIEEETENSEQKVCLIAEGAALKDAYRFKGLGKYKFEGWSQPTYSGVDENVPLTTVVASCLLKATTTSIPFKVRVEFRGHSFPREEADAMARYRTALQQVYDDVKEVNEPIDEEHKVVSASRGKIREELQERFIDLQVNTYRFLPESHSLDTYTRIRLKGIVRGLRRTFFGENWEVSAGKYPQLFLKMALARYEHLGQFHINILDVMAAREAQITRDHLDQQLSLKRDSKGLDHQRQWQLSEQLMEEAETKLLRLKKRFQDAKKSPADYQRRAESERRQVAVMLDSFKAIHVLAAFPERLRWKVELVLKELYSFLCANSDYDRLYIHSCARALLKRYEHLRMYHLDIVHNQQDAMIAIEEKYERLIKLLPDSPEKERQKEELDSKKLQRVQRLSERVELAATNPESNRISFDSKVDVILGRIRGILEFQDFTDEKLRLALTDILEGRQMQLDTEDLVSRTLVLETSQSNFGWGRRKRK